MPAHPDRSGRLLALAAALLFSTGGAAIKATAFTSWQVAGFRSAAAAVAVFVLLPAARRNWQWRLLPVAASYAATMVLFVAANKMTTAANAIFLQSTAPLYLMVFGPWLLREPTRPRDLLFMGVIAAGMATFFFGEQRHLATAPEPFTGNLIATLSGVAWAGTLAGLRWLGGRHPERDSTFATVVAGNLIACLVCLPPAMPVEEASAKDWLVVLYLGVIQIGLAYVCLTAALRRLPALETSLLLLAEPALNPIWAALVHGERPGHLALLGGGLILGATLARLAWADRRRSAAGA